MRRFAAMGLAAMSSPPTAMRPESAERKPVTIFIVVDFPAPFGPRNPSTSPRRTEKLMPSTALIGPKCLTRFSIWTRSVMYPPRFPASLRKRPHRLGQRRAIFARRLEPGKTEPPAST